MTLKIERDVPIPALTTRQGQNILLLKSMKVGDSVYFDAPIKAKAVRFYRVAKKLGVRVIIRKDREGMRMWRVDDNAGEDIGSEALAQTNTRQRAKDMVDRIDRVSRKGRVSAL
jgi:hypothetical protein